MLKLSRKPWLRTLFTVLLLLLVWWGVRSYTQRDALQGAVPELQGTLLNGTPVRWSGYRGSPVLVHVWATWCGICRMQEGSIESVARDYPVLSIATQSGSQAEVQDYLRRQDLTFPVLQDEDGSLARDFGIHGVPASFFVDAEGQVRFIEFGYTTEIGIRLRLWWLRRTQAAGRD